MTNPKMIKRPDGSESWWLDGKRHRADGPAIKRADGSGFWYLNGKLHRADGPAIKRADGSEDWWMNGKRHRVDGPAIKRADGSEFWYLHDRLLDSYYPNFGCAKGDILTREQALKRLEAKARPYAREKYLADINRLWPD